MKTKPEIGDLLYYIDTYNDRYIIKVKKYYRPNNILNYVCEVMDVIHEKTPVSKKGTSIVIVMYELILDCTINEIPDKYPEVLI
jgi:hypothetical protein